jgi:hypothetical protein
MDARTKIPLKSANSQKQALHKFLKPIPEKLEALLNIVNLLSMDIDILELIDDEPDYGKEDVDEWLCNQYEEIRSRIKNLPRQVKNYIGLPKNIDILKSRNTELSEYEFFDKFEDTSGQVWSAIKKFQDFCRYRYGVVSLIRIASSPQLKRNSWYSIPNPNFLILNSDGTIEVKTDLFFEAINGVEIKRIRQCPVCTSIFWAGRITQQCCTPRCSNIFRVRRHRFRTDEEKAELELKRLRRERQAIKTKRK